MRLPCGNLISSKSVKNLIELKSLVLCRTNNIKDDAFERLAKVTYLSLLHCDKNITGTSLPKLTSLSTFKLQREDGNLFDFQNIESLTQLKRLQASDNVPDSILKNFTNLEALELIRNESVTNDGISKLTKKRNCFRQNT